MVQRSTLQWNDDVPSGRGIQILEGQNSGGKENQAPGKQDQTPTGESTLRETLLGGGSSCHLYQHMNSNHNALPVHKGLQKLLLKPNVLQFCHHCQSYPSLHTYCIQSQFSHDTAVQCGSWIKCYMKMQPLVTKQLDLFWMNQGNLCLNENDRHSGEKQNLRISAHS